MFSNQATWIAAQRALADKECVTVPSTGRRDFLCTMAAGFLATTGGPLTASGDVWAQTPVPKKGGRIRVATQSSSVADTLDPAKGALGTDYVRNNMFYNGLTEFDAYLGAQLALARSIDQKSPTIWIIKLRRGVLFHDGKSMTAADVVYSLLRHKDPAFASKVKTIADQFKEIKATAPDEVRITLVGPNADLPVILADTHFQIVKDGATDFRTAVGTGPFKVKEFNPGGLTVAIRNENYWRPGRPYLDQIELIGIADEATRVDALLAGDLQLIGAVDPRSTSRIKQTAGFSVLETKTGKYTDLIMRDEGGITGNRDFRLGMKYLLDRQEILQGVFLGFGTIGNDQPIDPFNRFYLADLPQTPFDPDKAKFHFKKAGLGDTPLEVFAAPAAAGSIDMAALLQQAMVSIHLDLNITRVSSDGYWANHWMKHPLSFGNINARPSVDALFTQLFVSDAAWNEANWKNPKFDRLLMAARGEPDDAKRKKMYGDMQVLIHENGGVGIPAFVSSIDAHSSKLRGLGSIPIAGLMGFAFAEHVWLESS